MKLTVRQLEVLRFIERHIADRGFAPTWREIGDALGIRSTNGVHEQVVVLERKGYLTWEKGKSRTLRVLKKAPADIGKNQGAAERLFRGVKTPVHNSPARLSRSGGA